MILLIDICKERFYRLEFVKPIEKILEENEIKNEITHFKKIKSDFVLNADKIIICGTGLKDTEYLKNIEHFKWIKKFEKPILGICEGMQIVGNIFGANIKRKEEIGLTNIKFNKSFFGLKDRVEVYELHNFFVEPNESFESLATSKKCPQVITHKKKPFYGVLFHPEVRNETMIKKFALKNNGY